MMVTVYVYFKAASANRSLVAAALTSLVAEMTDAECRRADFARRIDDQAQDTWLEQYSFECASPSADWSARLAQHVAAVGLSALQIGERHVEVFAKHPPR